MNCIAKITYLLTNLYTQVCQCTVSEQLCSGIIAAIESFEPEFVQVTELTMIASARFGSDKEMMVLGNFQSVVLDYLSHRNAHHGED